MKKNFDSKTMILPGALIFVLCWLGYNNSLKNDFMLDDYTVLFGEKGVSNKTVVALFTQKQHLFYRPVGHLILMLSYSLFGNYPAGYHWVNLFLFFGIVLLFFRITQLLFDDISLAYLTAVLFCLHPINGMLVNYVTATGISTFVISLQLSFLCFLRYLNTTKRFFYCLSLFFFLLGLLSHEMSLVYPGYIFCVLYFLKNYSWKRTVVLCFPFLFLALSYLFFRMEFFSVRGILKVPFKVVTMVGAYFSSLNHLIVWYLSKLVMPSGILFLWSERIVEKGNFIVEQVMFAGIILILFYLVFGRWKKGIKAFALAFFLIGFIPCFWASYTYFPYLDPIIEPHWFYFSSFGFFLFLSSVLLKWMGKIKVKMIGALSVLGVLLFLFFCLQQNNASWKDQETYCRYWLSLNGRNMTPYYGLGKSLTQKGEYAEAIKYFEKGLKTTAYHSAFIYADIGYAYFLKGDNQQAAERYSIALGEDPQYSVTYYYSGLLFLKEKQFDQAKKAFSRAHELYPKDERYLKYATATP